MTVLDAVDCIVNEYYASIVKHGDWSDYSVAQMLEVTGDELLEAMQAAADDDISGVHGIVAEAAHTAVCCIKLMMAVSNQALRPAVVPGPLCMIRHSQEISPDTGAAV